MKAFRKIISLTVLLALSVLISSSINPQKKIKLRLNLKENKTYKFEVVTEQEILQEVMGMEQKIIQNYTLAYDYHVIEKLSNGDMRIQIKYTHVKFFQEMPMSSVDYDSDTNEGDIPDAAKGFAALVDEGFEILITPMGKITEIKGVEEMIDKILSKSGADEIENEQLKQTLNTQFGAEAIKSGIENNMSVYPKKSVKQGDFWEIENYIKTVFTLSVKNTFKLEELKGKTAKITVNSTIESEEENNEMEISGMIMKFDLKGKQAGTILMDTKTGFIEESKILQEVSGDVSMNFQGEDMSFPMTIKTSSKVNLLK